MPVRTQVLFIVSLGVVLVVPAIAIHIGGLVSYIGLVTVLTWLIAAWRRVVAKAERHGAHSTLRQVLAIAARQSGPDREARRAGD